MAVAIVSTPDGPMELFVAQPKGAGSHPGLLIIQEAFGVNDHIKDVTQRFVAQGYYAVAPDMFHRFDQRLVPYYDVRTAISLVRQLSLDAILADVNAALGYLRSQQEVGKIGIVGYCFGGYAAYLAATRTSELTAAVSYYGSGIADPRNPNAPIAKSADIAAALLLLFGGQDQMNPQDQVQTIDDTLQQLGKDYQLKVYPEAGHGFFCDARESYNKEAAEDAWNITLEFLGKHLS